MIKSCNDDILRDIVSEFDQSADHSQSHNVISADYRIRKSLAGICQFIGNCDRLFIDPVAIVNIFIFEFKTVFSHYFPHDTGSVDGINMVLVTADINDFLNVMLRNQMLNEFSHSFLVVISEIRDTVDLHAYTDHRDTLLFGFPAQFLSSGNIIQQVRKDYQSVIFLKSGEIINI